jgi:antitoxin VapB
MARTKVFRSGNSQAVRLPVGFRVEAKELEIFRRGGEIVLREPLGSMARAFHLLAELPEDALPESREDEPPQERNGW